MVNPREREGTIAEKVRAPWQAPEETVCEICRRQFKGVEEVYSGDMFCAMMYDTPGGCAPGDCDIPATMEDTPERWARWYAWGHAKLANMATERRDRKLRRRREQLDHRERGGWRKDPTEDGRRDNWRHRRDDGAVEGGPRWTV